MSFNPEEILSTLYQNPPEMYELKKASITKSSFSPPGITPRRQYSETPFFEVMEPPTFKKNAVQIQKSETTDFPIINMNQRKLYSK